jgi:hypothetical protein
MGSGGNSNVNAMVFGKPQKCYYDAAAHDHDLGTDVIR